MEVVFLRSVHLLNYRNHEDSKFEFSPKINGILGNNGVGKTSLLDSVHFLSMCKSYFVSSERMLVRKGEDHLMVSGEFSKSEQKEVILGAWQEERRKVFKRNDKAYDRLADHIGQFPCVVIAPKDHDLIEGASEVRRRFVDQVISQSSPGYLDSLARYNRVLVQRNKLLKDAFGTSANLEDLLLPFDLQLQQYAEVIFQGRKEFGSTMQGLVAEYYSKISGGKELVELKYESDLHEESLENLLANSRRKDQQSGRTNFGVHKDDFAWLIEGEKLKVFGSQGQQKSFLIALKLAQFDFLAQKTDRQPIMLLDDIFDKLDEHRVTHLIELVNTHHFGQIFVTDTHKERTAAILQRINEDSVIIELEN